MSWFCVEQRAGPVTSFGRYQRKLIFGDNCSIHQSLESARQNQPISSDHNSLYGHNVFYRENEVTNEGILVCSSVATKMTPDRIIAELLNSETEIRNFCSQNGIGTDEKHLFGLILDAYNLLTKLLTSPSSNTENSPRLPSSLKRKSPTQSSPRNEPKRPMVAPFTNPQMIPNLGQMFPNMGQLQGQIANIQSMPNIPNMGITPNMVLPNMGHPILSHDSTVVELPEHEPEHEIIQNDSNNKVSFCHDEPKQE